jgi:3-hydroxyacyl-CoA dehydrogenase
VNKQFGMPMGPMRLMDLVGGDISLHVGANFVENFADRVYTSHLIPLLNDAKRLGEKTGKGIYVYDAKRKAQPDPDLEVCLHHAPASFRLTAGLVHTLKVYRAFVCLQHWIGLLPVTGR